MELAEKIIIHMHHDPNIRDNGIEASAITIS
jgi:hypothetical protein